MAGLRPGELKFRYFDNNGNPLAYGKVFTYVSGTNTPLITWADVDGNANNTNPVILDSRGEANIFCQPGKNYRFTVTDSNDVVIETEDNIAGAQPAAASEWINPRSFGAVGDGVADDTLPMQQALDAAISTGYTLYIPAGTYNVTGLIYSGPFKLVGDGNLKTIIYMTATSGSIFSATPTCAIMIGTSLSDVYLQGPGKAVGSTRGWSSRTNGSNRHITFQRVRARYFSDVAFFITDSFNMRWDDCYILDCGDFTTAQGGGIQFNDVNFGDVSTTGNMVSNCYIAACGNGIFTDNDVVDQVGGLVCIQTIFENNGYGFFSLRAFNTTFINCYAEAQIFKFVKTSGATFINCTQSPPTASTTDGVDISGTAFFWPARSTSTITNTNIDILKLTHGDAGQRVDTLRAASGAIQIDVFGSSKLYSNNGAPEGVVTAGPGSLCINRAGTTGSTMLYTKVSGSGNTGWAPLNSGTPVPLSGTTAERPAAGDVERGTPYYNSDRGRVEWSNGISVWRQYNGNQSVSGLLADIPTPEYEGATYYATDRDALLVQDASAFRTVWVMPVFTAGTDGGTTTVGARGGLIVNTTAGTLATHTVTLPSGGNVSNGDRVRFATRGAITTLTVNGGTVLNAPATLTAGGFVEFAYDGNGGVWQRIG